MIFWANMKVLLRHLDWGLKTRTVTQHDNNMTTTRPTDLFQTIWQRFDSILAAVFEQQ